MDGGEDMMQGGGWQVGDHMVSCSVVVQSKSSHLCRIFLQLYITNIVFYKL